MTAKQNEARVEKRARLISAQKLRLLVDKEGIRLPDDIWQQMVPAAQTQLMAEDKDALLAEAIKVLAEMWSIGGALCQPMAEAGLDGRWEAASERYHALLSRMGEGS